MQNTQERDPMRLDDHLWNDQLVDHFIMVNDDQSPAGKKIRSRAGKLNQSLPARCGFQQHNQRLLEFFKRAGLQNELFFTDPLLIDRTIIELVTIARMSPDSLFPWLMPMLSEMREIASRTRVSRAGLIACEQANAYSNGPN